MKLPWITLVVMIVFWVATGYMVARTHALFFDWDEIARMAYHGATAIALVLAAVGISKRKTTAKRLFVANQVLCWSFAASPLIVVALVCVVLWNLKI